MHAHQTVEILHLHPLQGPTRNRHQTKIKSPVLPRRMFVSENKKATWTKTVFNEFMSMLKRFQWLQKNISEYIYIWKFSFTRQVNIW